MQEFVIVQPSYPGNRVWAIAVLPFFFGKMYAYCHWAPMQPLQPRLERTLIVVLGPVSVTVTSDMIATNYYGMI